MQSRAISGTLLFREKSSVPEDKRIHLTRASTLTMDVLGSGVQRANGATILNPSRDAHKPAVPDPSFDADESAVPGGKVEFNGVGFYNSIPTLI